MPMGDVAVTMRAFTQVDDEKWTTTDRVGGACDVP
jgi:hypothetical protein